MTADASIDPARFLSEQLDRASPDLLRSLLKTFVDALNGRRGRRGVRRTVRGDGHRIG